MFVRIKKSGSKKTPLEYLQIVESYRDGKKVRQRVIGTLGRLDHLKASGQIDGLVKSLARFSETLRVLTAAKDPKITTCKAKQWGPALIFDKLWQSQQMPRVIDLFAGNRRFKFNIDGFVKSSLRFILLKIWQKPKFSSCFFDGDMVWFIK